MPRPRKRRKTRKRKVSAYARCIGGELRGRKFANPAAVRKAFKLATKTCTLRITRRRR